MGPESTRQPALAAAYRRLSRMVLAGVVVGALACSPGGNADPPERGEPGARFRGVRIEEPPPRPEVTLTDTEGEPFHLRRQTRGYVTLLFFGYTHCPDVCPVQLANLSAVLHDLTPSLRQQIRVVFVTVDPERDTRSRLREWLRRFDAQIVGLRGSRAKVDSVQRSLGMTPAALQRSRTTPSGGYTVGHSSQFLAFTKQGPARLAYPSGTRQADWAHDLPRLATRGWPGAGSPSGSDSGEE